MERGIHAAQGHRSNSNQGHSTRWATWANSRLNIYISRGKRSMVQYKYCVGYVIPPALSCLSGVCVALLLPGCREYGHIKSQNRCVRIYNMFISAILQHREVTVKEGKCRNYESLLSVPTFLIIYCISLLDRYHTCVIVATVVYFTKYWWYQMYLWLVEWEQQHTGLNGLTPHYSASTQSAVKAPFNCCNVDTTSCIPGVSDLPAG